MTESHVRITRDTIMDWLSKLSPDAVKLYVFLLAFRNKTGIVYAKETTIRESSGLSKRRITRAKKELAQTPLVQIRKRYSGANRRKTDEWFISP